MALDIKTVSFGGYDKNATETYVSEEIARVVGEAPEAFDTLKEIADKLSDNDDVVDALVRDIASKADSNHNHDGVYLTEHQDITGKANVGDSYTKAESDAKYLTEHQDITGKANVGDSYTKAESDAKYLTEHQSLSGYATETYVDTAIENVVGMAPENFDTIKELADSLTELKVIDVEAVEEVEPVNAIYSFISYADQEATQQYGEGTVEVTELREEGATVKVLTNTEESFVGQEFDVVSLDETDTLQLYQNGVAQPIYVKVTKVSDAIEGVEAVEEVSHNMTIGEFVTNAIETVDECVGKIVDAIKATNGTMFICADHGNADMMIDYETGEPWTAHTTNPVPFILVNYDEAYTLRENGCLADIIPTLIECMGEKQPEEMTGKSLLIKK